MKQLLKLSVLLIPLLIGGCASAPSSTTRASTLTAILAAQGFSSSLEPLLEIKPIGSVLTSNGRYDVYYYVHVTSEKQAPRGLHKLIVLRDDTYLGSYLIDDDPTPVAHVAGDTLIFDYPASSPGLLLENRVQFNERGPPASVLIDGLYSELSK